jgi:excisionase family DNA binding protein
MNKLSTKETAERLDISTVRVFQLIKAGRLPAEKIGRDWFVKESDLETFEQNRLERGRPPKAKDEKKTE